MSQHTWKETKFPAISVPEKSELLYWDERHKKYRLVVYKSRIIFLFTPTEPNLPNILGNPSRTGL